MRNIIKIVTDDKDYVVISQELRFPVKSKRKSYKSEEYLKKELKVAGDVFRVSGQSAAILCGDGTIDIYEF